MSALRTVDQVAADLQCSAWTIAELVRLKRVSCIRINTTDSANGPIRFTDEQVARILIELTVAADKPEVARRRKRRAS